MTLAAIDCGTNSIRLLIADVGGGTGARDDLVNVERDAANALAEVAFCGWVKEAIGNVSLGVTGIVHAARHVGGIAIGARGRLHYRRVAGRLRAAIVSVSLRDDLVLECTGIAGGQIVPRGWFTLSA